MQLASEITVEWGCDLHSITLTPRNWTKVKEGKPLKIRGKGYHCEGDFFWDYWSFNSIEGNEIYVTYGEDGGEGFIGNLNDAVSINEFEYKPPKRKTNTTYLGSYEIWGSTSSWEATLEIRKAENNQWLVFWEGEEGAKETFGPATLFELEKSLEHGPAWCPPDEFRKMLKGTELV
ncbi:hypothetical protein N8697_00915 [bacterium]|nr:hypothetical protein [bacterium]